SRFCSIAWRAVDSDPLRGAASTTTTPNSTALSLVPLTTFYLCQIDAQSFQLLQCRLGMAFPGLVIAPLCVPDLGCRPGQLLLNLLGFGDPPGSHHAPPREGHQQQGRYSGFRRCVAHEEFDLGGLQDIAGHHQVEPLSGQAVGVFDRDHDVLTFPHHWPLLAVLDMEPLPGPIAQPWVAQHPVDPLGRWTTAGQSGHLPAPTAAMETIGPVDNPRRVEPAREAPRHLADVPLAVARQCPQELRLAAIALVERQPLETDAAGD